MFDVHKYLSNGAVKREKIATDIKYRIIGTEELNVIVNDADVKAAFFGHGFQDKIPMDQWTEKYLDELSCAVAAKCFNAEYLYYLNEVAEYVNKKKGNSKLIIGAVVLVVAVAALFLAFSGWNK